MIYNIDGRYEKGVDIMIRMTEYTNKEKGFALPASLPDNDLGNTYSLEDICCKLAPFEDAEEQDRLIIIPCKIGDIVYDVVLCTDNKYRIFEMKVCSIAKYGGIWKNKVWNVYLEDDYTKAYRIFSDFGKTVFLTREEAESALKANL